jgi:hypothetical protein
MKNVGGPAKLNSDAYVSSDCRNGGPSSHDESGGPWFAAFAVLVIVLALIFGPPFRL